MFDLIARLVSRRPWGVLVAALFFLVMSVIAGAGVSDRLQNGGANDPASESSRAAEVLDREFPGARPNLVLHVRSSASVDDPAVAAAGAALARRLADEDTIVGVTSYWQTKSPSLRSTDGHEALILARIEGDETAAGKALDQLRPEYRGTHDGLTVRLGGQTAIFADSQDRVAEDLLKAELIALPITLLVLVFVFGSVVAALLPLLVGIIAILGTNAALRAITEFTDVSIFAQNLTTALSLGLAIDYALFVVRRYREELAKGHEPRAAIAVTLRTAGRTVLFSALTVAVSLAAMLVFPLYFLRSFAYAGISVVVLAAAAALLVLPAALLLLGRRVDALDVRRLLGRRAAARRRTAEPGRGWGRLGSLVMRRAPLFALGTVGLLVALGLPFLGVQFGTADDRQLPANAESRVVQQAIRDGFEGSATGVVEIVTRRAASADALGDYARRLSDLPGVVRVQSPVGTYAAGRLAQPATPLDGARTAGDVSYLSVVSDVEDISAESLALVRTIRAAPSPVPTLVAGRAAAQVDTQHAIGSRLWYAGGIVIGATLVLLFLMTGSIVLAVQAILTNALSLTAMFGAAVWVFQDGNLSGVLGFTPTGYIETALPVLMFCVAFGLSMDYGVFLLSRVKEEYDRTGDTRAAVVTGLARTGGLITAAATILAIVLAAIGTSQILNSKLLGLGLALAVLMDATVVRGLLVPAVMGMLGKAAWWSPGPLRRFHERFGLSEGEPAVEPAALPEPVGAAR